MKIIVASIISIIITFLMISYFFFNGSKSIIGEQINYCTKDRMFTFTAIPSKGRDYKMMERELEIYKNTNGIKGEVVIYRLTKKNYLRIDKWCQYKIMPEWQYPLYSNK